MFEPEQFEAALAQVRSWRLLHRVEGNGQGCWLWTGATSHGGYGAVQWNGQVTGAHRVTFELAKGPIPIGLTIDHLCRNRLCVNPDHLEAVSIQENNRRKPAYRLCRRGHDVEAVGWVSAGSDKRTCRAISTKQYNDRRRLAKAAFAAAVAK
jgi:hypothetical protein